MTTAALSEKLAASEEEKAALRTKLHNAIRKGKSIEAERAELHARLTALESSGGNAAAGVRQPVPPRSIISQPCAADTSYDS